MNVAGGHTNCQCWSEPIHNTESNYDQIGEVIFEQTLWSAHVMTWNEEAWFLTGLCQQCMNTGCSSSHIWDRYNGSSWIFWNRGLSWQSSLQVDFLLYLDCCIFIILLPIWGYLTQAKWVKAELWVQILVRIWKRERYMYTHTQMNACHDHRNCFITAHA